MKTKQLLIITELPKKIDIDSIPLFIGKTPPLVRNGEYEFWKGYNHCLFEIKSKSVELDVEKLAGLLYSRANQNAEDLDFEDFLSDAKAIKQAIERGELWREK